MEKRQSEISVKRLQPEPERGLTRRQAEERRLAGYTNVVKDTLSKSEGRIVADNVFTFFNFLFFLLAACLFAVGKYTDMLFFGIIIVNTLIGIVQELRVKRTLDKIALLSQRPVTVIREGERVPLSPEELVLDDIVVFGPGSQICADAIVCRGSAEVNEALLTGESDAVAKRRGDLLLSGSFITAGSCYARLERVGDASYAAGITGEAKQKKKYRSEMTRSLDRLLKWIGVIIIPAGLILFAKQAGMDGVGFSYAVSSTVASMVGMIPEGLYLLVSAALALSVIRLAKRHTLVHEMACIENLARVDVLCLDKTGTITEGEMEVAELVPATGEDGGNFADQLLGYAGAISDENATARALKACAGLRRPGLEENSQESGWRAAREIPFSSERKWSALELLTGERFFLGAPERILGEGIAEYEEMIRPYLAGGKRVLVLAKETAPMPGYGRDGIAPDQVQALGFVILEDKIRDNAKETLRYFREQGVQLKVISGDNAVSAAAVAARAGVEHAECYLDMAAYAEEAGANGAEEEPDRMMLAAEEHTVFGRVSPKQKRELIRGLKSAGHTVAMIGDGVNDVLALKEADCSIAMAAGSEAAQHVAQLVLLHSDFSVMPQIVREGRRVIHNIQRSASLFLVKNIYSFLITTVLLFAAMPYPFVPIQLTLLSGLLIGIPSFLLALEPSCERIRGSFLRTVLLNALPGGLVSGACVLSILWFGAAWGVPMAELSTVCTLAAGVNGIAVLCFLCWPFTLPRLVLTAAVGAGFFGAALMLAPLFHIEALSRAAQELFLLSAVSGPLLMCAAVFIVSRMKRGGGGNGRKERKRGLSAEII